MSAVTVVALRSFTFEGRFVEAGEAVTMVPVQASIQGYKGNVSLDPQMRPTYRRRDLVASTPESNSPVMLTAGEVMLTPAQQEGIAQAIAQSFPPVDLVTQPPRKRTVTRRRTRRTRAIA